MCSTTQSCKERKELLQQLRYRLLMVRSKLTGRFRNETRRQWRWRAQILIWLDHTLGSFRGFFSRAAPRFGQRKPETAHEKSLAPRVAQQLSPAAERKVEHWKSCSVSSALFLVLISRCVVVPIMGWSRKRTGTSFDDGKERRTD